jgi:membrane dipeptidase
VDCHHDLLLLVARDRLYGLRDSFGRRWVSEWRAGGVDVQVVPIHIESEFPLEAALRRTMKLIAVLHDEVAMNGDDVALCRSGSDVSSALSSGRIALILAFEGSQAVGLDVELFGLFFQLGLRMASFTWMGRTFLADGSREDGAGGRLTSTGVEALRELERLGILMDISHLSDSGTDHVLEIAARPVVASHSSARALAAHSRNLTDDQMRGVAATGGVIGVNFFPLFIDETSPTIDRIVDHIEHIASVAGIEHVGIGTDFVTELYREKYPVSRRLEIDGVDPRIPIKGLESARDLPRLTTTLLRRGFSEQAVRRVLGENFLRVFREVLGQPATT